MIKYKKCKLLFFSGNLSSEVVTEVPIPDSVTPENVTSDELLINFLRAVRVESVEGVKFLVVTDTDQTSQAISLDQVNDIKLELVEDKILTEEEIHIPKFLGDVKRGY